MPIRLSPQTGFLLPATLAIALAAWPAAAQQSTPTPPPPTPNQPTSDAAGKLRGINPPPFPMAADKLPVPQLKAPKGFKIDVFMSGIPNARSLRIGDKGTVFVSNRLLDKVYAVVEKNGKRELKTLASGLDRPNGLAFHNGTLYIAEGTKISKLEKIRPSPS
jgi:glucose/arabinose dehydrogenase